MRAKNNNLLPRLESNSDRLDRRQHRLPLSHRVIFFFIGSVLINANRIHFFIYSCFFYSVLRPFQGYFRSYETGQSKTGEPREKRPGTPVFLVSLFELMLNAPVASISWDVHTKLGCHGIQNVLQIYSAKLITQRRFICYVIQINFISTGLDCRAIDTYNSIWF